MFQPATSRAKHRDTSRTHTDAPASCESRRQFIVQQACVAIHLRSTNAVRCSATRGVSLQAGLAGVLSRILFDHHITHITHLAAASRRIVHLPLSLSIPIHFRHIGPCSVACAALPCPCALEFPLSLPIARNSHFSPDLRHGAW